MLNRFAVVALICFLAAGGLVAGDETGGPPVKPHPTDWFKKAGWGVFTHYLTGANMSVEEWNRRVDAFDVPGLVKQLEAI